MSNPKITIKNLSENTNYYYRLRAVNSADAPSENSNTINAETIEYLTISGLGASGIQPYGALISWTSNKACTSVLQYRETGSGTWLDFYDSSPVTDTSHSVLLTGLKMSTNYDIRAYGESADPFESDEATSGFVTTNIYYGDEENLFAIPSSEIIPAASIIALAVAVASSTLVDTSNDTSETLADTNLQTAVASDVFAAASIIPLAVTRLVDSWYIALTIT